MSTPKVKKERLQTQVTSSQKELIQKAALIEGLSVSEYIIQKAQEAAHKTIQENERMILGEEDSRAFVEALLNPGKPNKKLIEAYQFYKKVMES